MSSDRTPPSGALHFPATARNRDPLLAVLREHLAPPVRSVLEIASGSGEHALYFARHLPHLRWQPTDAEAEHVASVEAWRALDGSPNLAPARSLDVLSDDWGVDPTDAVFVANLFHISPWACVVAFFAGATRCVRPGGLVLSYGPYKIDGAHTAPSNERFDASLRARDPRWGVRDTTEIAAVAHGFTLERRVPMPAENFTLVWRHEG